MCNLRLQAVESTCAVTAVLHEAKALQCQHGFRFPRSSMAHVAQSPEATFLAAANHVHVSAAHSAGSTAARTPSSVVSGSSIVKQQPQAATSHSAAAATYRVARPLKQFWCASLRHCSAGWRLAIKKRERHIHHMSENNHISLHTFALNNMIRVRASCAWALERNIHHMSESNHISTQICLQQHDSSVCELCVCSVIK